jgi:catechol 2,3-dioxygenase
MQSADANREYGIAPPGYRLPELTRLGRVHLQVTDLARSVAYYRDLLGLRVVHQNATTASLAVVDSGDALLELHYERGTRSVARGETLGLYHFAILVPSRAALGRFVKRLAAGPVQFGAADHLVSEATYLWDPDGLGIEVYRDRPRQTWQTNGRELAMATERLDLASVMDAAGANTWNGMPAGTTMGHMHLSVGDLDTARTFYHHGLGLDTTVWSYPGALFMSAGGYHHHLGTNTWAMGGRAPIESDARLLEWELVLPARADIDAATASVRASGYDVRADVITDPWGTTLRLTAAS